MVETPAEVPLLINTSKALNIRPHLGVRVKLASRVGGHWNATSGDRSIFGLNPSQLIDLIDELNANDDVVGILYSKDLLPELAKGPDEPRRPISALLRKPQFVPETKAVDDLLTSRHRRLLGLFTSPAYYCGD